MGRKEIPWPRDAAEPTWSSGERRGSSQPPAPRVTVEHLYRLEEEVECRELTAAELAAATGLTCRQVDVGLQQLRKLGVLVFDRTARRWWRTS